MKKKLSDEEFAAFERKLEERNDIAAHKEMGEGMMFAVTEKAKRPAGRDGVCTYCQEPFGATHKSDCVLVQKKVTVRMIVEYEINVPASWDGDMIEFHRNESSWCADNALDELEGIIERDGCLCQACRFEYVGNDSKPFLDE